MNLLYPVIQYNSIPLYYYGKDISTIAQHYIEVYQGLYLLRNPRYLQVL